MTAKTRTSILVILVVLGLLGGAYLLAVARRTPVEQAVRAQTTTPAPSNVSSLGRIRPEDAPVIVGARSLSGQPSLVRELRVKEGDVVEQGHIVAVLDSQAELEAAAKEAEQRVNVAQAVLRQVQAGAKPADLAAIQAQIARLEVELANAKRVYSRSQALYADRIVSESVLDQDRLAVETIPQQIAEVRERLRSAGEVRQVDVDVATAELHQAEAELRRATATAAAAVVRAPYSGMVLKVHAWQGSEVGPRGILELARVEKMYVLAEVAESDVRRVKVGQRARITGDSLPRPLDGVVERLGSRVSRNSIAVDNPVNITDARVVEVWVRIDDPSTVRNLTDAQVTVVIAL